MKLLLLHPQMSSGHPLAILLQARGALVLTATTPEEALQILRLHGGAMDAAVLHREGAEETGADGLRFVPLVRREPSMVDLPMVITSTVWGDADFATHQESADGVNAYLRWSDVDAQLYSTLCQVLGRRETPAAHRTGVSLEALTTSLQVPAQLPATSSISLQVDPSQVISSSGQSLMTDPSLATRVLSLGELKQESVAPVELALSGTQLGAVLEPSVSVKVEAPTSPTRSPTSSDDFAPEKELPYLFGRGRNASEVMPVVLGDAVVPGGAAQSPDVETLKRFLELREKDVSALAIQLREARELLRRTQEELQISHKLMEEQGARIEGASRREEEFEREKALLTEGVQAELETLRFELKAKNDKIRLLQSQVRAGERELEHMKERVRADLRAIKTNERRLENQLDMQRRDSQSLLASRESVIVELKRKLDLAEFNLDILQDRLGREKVKGEELRAKLVRASQAVRVAGGLLDPPEPVEDAGEGHAPVGRKAS